MLSSFIVFVERKLYKHKRKLLTKLLTSEGSYPMWLLSV